MKKKRFLKSIARISYNHPWKVVAFFVFITFLSLVPAQDLSITPRWSDLLPEDEPSVQQYEKIIKKYKTASTLMVVLEGPEEKIKNAADELVDSLRGKPLINRIDYRMDKEFLKNYGLLLISPDDLENNREIFSSPNVLQVLKNLNHSLQKTYIYSESGDELSSREERDNAIQTLNGIHYFLKTLEDYYKNPGNREYEAGEGVERLLIGDEYMLSYDRNMLLVLVVPNFTVTDVDRCHQLTHSVRRTGDRILSDKPGVKMGATGMVALSSDELDSIEKPLFVFTMISFVLIIVLFILSFRIFISPLFSGLILIESVIFTAGLAGVIYGELNIMTSMFAVILLGLIIDFSIHIISNFQEQISSGKGLKDSLEETMIKAGGGIITGAVTTSIAFMALIISTNRGMKEFGAVVGGGVFLGMLTTVFLLPSILTLYHRHRKGKIAPGYEFEKLGITGNFLKNNHVIILVGLIILTVFFFFQGRKTEFDYNMLNIEPEGMESVVYNYRVIEKFDLTPDYALFSSPSIRETRDVVDRVEDFEIIGMVNSIVNYLPEKERQKRSLKIIDEIRKNFRQKEEENYTTEDMRELFAHLDTLWMNITELSVLSFQQGRTRVENKCYRIVENPGDSLSGDYLKNLIAELRENPLRTEKAFNELQDDAYPHFKGYLKRLLDSKIITEDKIPPSIKSEFLSNDSTEYLTTMFANADVWDIKNLKTFNKILKKVEPGITGTPVTFLALIDMIKKDGKNATILATVLIFILLLINYRRISLALLTMIPLGVSLIWLLAFMNFLGMKLNVVNIMALPLILGIGIDDGVHFVHRYISEDGNIFKTYSSTGKATLLTTLTTMVGFGILSFLPHRGMASMGLVLFMGIGICWITTVLFLAPILTLFSRDK